MANNEFDFEAFKAQKFAEYKKKEIKPALVRKAKAGIVFVDYKLAGKKTACVFIPIKKVPEAMTMFKAIKKNKEHLLKKTALVSVALSKADEGGDLISLSIQKGGLSSELLQSKGTELFETILKMKLKVLGGAQTDGTEESTSQAEESNQEKSNKPLTEAQKEQIKANVSKIGSQLEKIAKALKIEI